VNCPDCKSENRKLLESRLTVRGKRRRRFECRVCLHRWTMFNDESKGRAYTHRWETSAAQKAAWRRLKRDDILKIIKSHLPQRMLAEKYGVTRQSISRIQLGLMYKDIYAEINPPRTGPVVYCTGCANWEYDSCGFGFPEAGGDFATYCCVYSPSTLTDVVQ
jgi:transposase-like protein